MRKGETEMNSRAKVCFSKSLSRKGLISNKIDKLNVCGGVQYYVFAAKLNQ